MPLLFVSKIVHGGVAIKGGDYFDILADKKFNFFNCFGGRLVLHEPGHFV